MAHEDELPWTEEQWERLMKESDLRSARFGELLETLIDHPDRTDLIAHEMGWDRGDEPDDVEYEPDLPDFETADSEESAESVDLEEDDAELADIPAYRAAFDAGERVRHALSPFISRADSRDEEMGELLGEAVIGAHIAAAKIAGGHAMGYDDDVLCGNIVNCRRGLAGIQQSEAALAALRDRDVIPADLADSLVQQIQPARQLLEERIAELRSRVWW